MTAATTVYDRDLPKTPANFLPLTPLTFLDRAAATFPARLAVVHGDRRFTYAEFDARRRRLGSALKAHGIAAGDTVSILCPNTPPMLEAHYGVPMTGGVINAINYRLSAQEIAFILDHGEAKIFIVDSEFGALARAALGQCKAKPLVIGIDDPEHEGGEVIGEIEYEAFIAKGDAAYAGEPIADEWNAIALNYTSGTTGNPKGVVFHHRGAYLAAIGNVVTAGMAANPAYLWTLPMFHCNGWCYTWAISTVAGTHVCLRKTEAARIYDAIAKHGVTHMCGAPVVMNMLVNATEAQKAAKGDRSVEFYTAAAPPPAAVLQKMEAAGFRVTHIYGLTETYGPSVINDWNEDWDALDAAERARLKARQGVKYQVLEDLAVLDPETMQPVPKDGEAMGEVFFRGNIVMKGYLKNPTATEAAFKDGWFHSGDLGVWDADGYIRLKDRSKDIIISGGENISSIEVEDVLYRHPAVFEAAVVGRPDEQWGEVAIAFVTLKPGGEASEQELIEFVRSEIARYKAPKKIVFGDLPKTSTGKVQKFKLRDQARPIGI
ncbi:MAG: acyl-CoA synthetase [Alphaproteobacteria bacterium]|nr:acyl-CoA synthetase [Alphaproteobacteria bacterium]